MRFRCVGNDATMPNAVDNTSNLGIQATGQALWLLCKTAEWSPPAHWHCKVVPLQCCDKTMSAGCVDCRRCLMFDNLVSHFESRARHTELKAKKQSDEWSYKAIFALLPWTNAVRLKAVDPS